MGLYSSFVRAFTFPLIYKRDGVDNIYHHLNELEESQYYSQNELKELQFQKLKKLLNHSYKNTDFYHKRLNNVGLLNGEINSLEDLKKIPILTKEEIRDYQSELKSGNFGEDELHFAHSGGTSGIKIIFFRDNACLSPKNASTIRQERWSGWDIGDRTGLIWPARQDYVGHHGLKAKIKNALFFRHIILPAAILTEEEIRDYCLKIKRLKPTTLKGFPASIKPVSEYIINNKIDVGPMNIITTGEPLYDNQRECFEKAFNGKVYDSYGSRETGLIAQECEKHNGMHINAENIIVEILGEDDLPVKDGEIGRVIVTDLLNYGMPMIRYSLDDLAALSSESCSCGRGLPILEGVHGRAADEIIRADGKKISPVSLVLYLVGNGPPVGQIQIIQEKINHIRIKISNNPMPDEYLYNHYRETIHNLLGEDTEVSFQVVDRIPREKSGKYKYIKSYIL